MEEWESKDIITSFNGIIRDAKELSVGELEIKYADFKEANNKLYEMAIDSVTKDTVQETLKMLKMMLTARDKMKNGTATKLNTDIFVGNELGKKYIYPKTNKPSAADFKQALDKINEKIRENEKEENDEKEN